MKETSAKPATAAVVKKTVAAPRTLAPRILAIDIGGTGIKALTLDSAGKPLNERTKIATPKHARPKDVIAIIRKLAEAQAGFERVSAGFPGVVKDGIIYTAANLGKGWIGFDLRDALERKLRKPVRIANDADIQGLGCVSGRGLELVITLGTGFGSVLFADGTRVHLELGHHPFRRGKTYEDELGNRALKKKGRKNWNKILQEAIAELQKTFNYDRLYLGGGNSRLVSFKLPDNVKIISNEDGLLGGIALWRDAQRELPQQESGKASAKPDPVVVKSLAKASSKSSSQATSQAVPSASSKRAEDVSTSGAPSTSPANGSPQNPAAHR